MRDGVHFSGCFKEWEPNLRGFGSFLVHFVPGKSIGGEDGPLELHNFISQKLWK